MEDEDLLILYSQYYGCWWPGDARSQEISSNYMDYFHRNILILAPEGLIIIAFKLFEVATFL